MKPLGEEVRLFITLENIYFTRAQILVTLETDSTEYISHIFNYLILLLLMLFTGRNLLRNKTLLQI